MFLIQLKSKDVKKVKDAFNSAKDFVTEKASDIVASAKANQKSPELRTLECQLRLREVELEILKEIHKKENK
ncbi:MAG TPA: hypothetical protein VK190_03400 [Pseudoneobacillus sp.]|nr:hypothetical protein [Pseudoneobacillus sp.]